MSAQLHGIQRKVRRRLEAESSKGGLTGPQRLVMQALVESDGMSLKQLSQTVSLAHSTVSGIVDRLEKRGLVERHTLDSDRRVTQIRASRAVQQFPQKRAPKLMLHPLVRALRRASAEERRAVSRGLEILERLLHQE